MENEQKILDQIRTNSFNQGYIAGQLLTRFLIEQYKSHHDNLTGLLNRHGLNELLNHKKLSNYALILCDVNNFKLINDLFGHNKGDEFLKNLSQNLQKSYRKSDIIARLGGDEFLILVNLEQRQDKIMTNLDKIKLIEDRFIEITKNIINQQPNEYVENDLGIAFGVVICSDDDTIYSAINKADQLMYQNKKQIKKFKRF